MTINNDDKAVAAVAAPQVIQKEITKKEKQFMKQLLVSQTQQWLELQQGMGSRTTDALMRKYQDYNLKYRAEIDGLRALAVVPVILFHAGFELFSGGLLALMCSL
jgi:hypothetical protein